MIGSAADAAAGEFRRRLRQDPCHVPSLCGLATVHLQRRESAAALRLLRHALRQTESFPRAWALLSQVLLASGRLLEAETTIRRALSLDAGNARYWIALASVNNRLLRAEAALAAYREAQRLDPALPLQLSIGHVLKALGRRSECERAYHECLAREPSSGEAYWSLADLKTYRFSDAEIEAMEALVRGGGRDEGNLARLHFALGRAREQRADARRAFAHYDLGNRMRRRQAPFDYAAFEATCARVIARFDRGFFAATAGAGHRDASPIFIVGLPRSGSTLVEQILASHSAVEGTMELPNIPAYVHELDALGADHDAYPDSACAAPPAVFGALGRRYVAETRPLRTGRLHFIDKMPNNFVHVGLIHAMLPDAVVIDVRRHPMDACLSCYRQHFAAGQAFSYDLAGLGRYYRQYLSVMDHWDRVLPGKVLRVSYEELVRDAEATIRRILGHCGLSFESACLQFHTTERLIRTASSEQVRQPLYVSSVGHWRRFERELEPLRRSLGSCLARFPEPAPLRRSGGPAAPPAPPRRPVSAVSLAVAAVMQAALWERAAAAPGPIDDLQEVIVTARKRAENVQDVPQSIDLLAARDVRNLDVVRIEDISLLAPSVSMISTGPGGQRLFIRGASDGSDPNFGHSNVSTTAFMVDDLSLNLYGHGPDLHLYDIERIEILNGPQGTLFGPGALSGALRVVTRKPDARAPSAGVDLEGAQIRAGGQSGSVEAYANLPLIEGSTALRVSAYHVRDGGYIDNELATRHWLNGVTSTNAAWVGRDQNTRDVLGGRVAIQHSWSDTGLVRLTAYYQQQTYQGTWDEDPTNVGPHEIRRFSPQGGFNYGRFLELHVEADAGIADLIYAGGYSSQRNRRLYDFSDYAQYDSYATFIQSLTCVTDPASAPGDHGCKVPYMYGQVDSIVERASNELRLQSKPGSRSHWTAGIYWEKTRNPYSGFEKLPNINFAGGPAQAQLVQYGGTPLPEEFYSDFADFRTLQLAEFGDLSYDLGDRWSLEGGIEHFRSSQSEHDYWYTYFQYPKIPSDWSASAKRTNFKAGLTFKPRAQTLAYLSFAQGFRDGGFNYVPANLSNPQIPRSFQPDTLNNFELGLKSGFWGGRLTWNNALYYMPWKNYQIGVSWPTAPFGFQANVGDVRIYGLESIVEGRPIDRLQISLRASYNDSTLITNSYENARFIVVPGEHLPEAPYFNWNGIVRYELDWRPGTRLYAQLDLDHKGSMFNSLRVNARLEQPGYTIGNLRVGASRPDSQWQAEAFVTNVANSHAVVFINTTGYDNYPGISNPEITVSPRTFGLRLHYRWGPGP
jgi:outer membrane receptor protein involved in Fe transport/tetratricopeptide (TPR) repeat protein